MEPFLFSLVMAWALVRYAATDLVATAKGTESPRYRERQQRLAQQHERKMARMRSGPTIGQAVASRIAHRIAEPKPPRDRSGQRPLRRFLAQWWDDSWNHATKRRHRHHERRESGDLPRQRAARATKDAFARWHEQWRHRHTPDPAATTGAGNTGGATTPPPETATERTGPIHVVAERLLLPPPADPGPATEPIPVTEVRDETQAGVLGADGTVSTWPATDPDTPDLSRGNPRWIEHALDPDRPSIPEERNPITMNTDHTTPAPTGEITNITTAMDYTRATAEQFRSAVTHAEGLAAQAQQVADWAEQASTSAETSIAGITAGEVTGEAVESLHAAQEQMTAAATQVAEAHRELTTAQEQFAATAAAFDTAHAAFQRHSTVAEAYAANPDAGSKQFNTYA